MGSPIAGASTSTTRSCIGDSQARVSPLPLNTHSCRLIRIVTSVRPTRGYGSGRLGMAAAYVLRSWSGLSFSRG
jgi:hypothetical protein